MDASKMDAKQINKFNEELAKFKKKILPVEIRPTLDNSRLFEAWFKKNNLLIENATASQWYAAYHALIPALDFIVEPKKRVDMQGKGDRGKPDHSKDKGWGENHFGDELRKKATTEEVDRILREARSLAENFVSRAHNHRIKQDQNRQLSEKHAQLKAKYPTPTVPQAQIILADLKKMAESF